VSGQGQPERDRGVGRETVELTEGPGPLGGEVVDLTNEPIGAPPVPLGTRPVDLEPERERKRGYLAAALVGVFGVVVLGSPLTLAFGADVEELKSLLEVILPPVIALTGTAVGFYFGGHRS
jgi:hypothetical protein